jgi:hypothetical protein
LPSIRSPSLVATAKRVTAVLLGCVAVSLACQRIDHAQQCRALVATVNPALDAIEQRRTDRGDRPEALLEIAATYEKLAHQLLQLKFSCSELRKLVAEYVVLLRRTGRTTRSAAAAVSGKDTAQLARLRGELSVLVRKQQLLSRSIDRQCLTPY